MHASSLKHDQTSPFALSVPETQIYKRAAFFPYKNVGKHRDMPPCEVNPIKEACCDVWLHFNGKKRACIILNLGLLGNLLRVG